MSTIDHDQLAGESGTEPPPGTYDAYLARCALVNSDKGTSLVSEWQAVGGGYYWTAWFGFAANRLQFTQDFLDAVGVNRRAGLQGRTQEERDQLFEEALHEVVGTVYRVRVELKGSYLNTYVDGPARPVQSDLPVDTSGLPAPAPPSEPAPTPVAAGAQGTLTDDDIPF